MLESNQEEVWEEIAVDGSVKEVPSKAKGSKREKGPAKTQTVTAENAKGAATPRPKVTLDFKDDEDSYQLLQSLLQQANDKAYGKKVEVLDLIKVGLSKIVQEDIDQLQDKSMSKMDKIHLAHEKYNRDNNLNLTFDEYLFQQLNIQ